MESVTARSFASVIHRDTIVTTRLTALSEENLDPVSLTGGVNSLSKDDPLAGMTHDREVSNRQEAAARHPMSMTGSTNAPA
jgi:hypothetical protein